jgi:hypothetical protein
MTHINKMYISTGISILFSVYSIYNIIDYLKTLNSTITELSNLLSITTKKYKDSQIKYNELQKKYNDLLNKYELIIKENSYLLETIDANENNANIIANEYANELDNDFVEPNIDNKADIIRSTSVKDVNWLGTAKKMLFG